jgi:predicted DNA-binding transcriptional regulator AlpA
MRFLSMQEVCALFGVTRTTIGRWEDECNFPVRVPLGMVKPSRLSNGRTKRSNCRIGFPDTEVYAWAQARMDARPSKEDGPPDEEE